MNGPGYLTGNGLMATTDTVSGIVGGQFGIGRGSGDPTLGVTGVLKVVGHTLQIVNGLIVG